MTTPTLTPVAGATPTYDDNGLERVEIATCGTCGRSWNDAAVSSMTPAPSGRCPFEYEHDELEAGTPGTTYTATPATYHDPAGRLADFARYARDELERILAELEGGDEIPLAVPVARRMQLNAVKLALRLEGFTTAADD